jgi:hypothetical protein
MRRRILLVLLLPACGNVTHPEYHPVTSVQCNRPAIDVCSAARDGQSTAAHAAGNSSSIAFAG